MIRRGLAVGLLSLLATAAHAAAMPAPIGPHEVLRGDFAEERQLQGFSAPLRSSGHFVLAPGHGLIWQAEKPFAIETIITPAGLVQKVNGAETMQLSSARLPFMAQLYRMLGGALAGDWQALGTEFTVETGTAGPQWQVTLKPRRAPSPTTMPFSAITVSGDRFVEKVVMDKPNGDRDMLTFSDQHLAAAPLSRDETAALDADPR